MTKVAAGITTSLDGYVAGPDDGPGKGLGEGGERLHYWVFGGPWSYQDEPRGEPTGADKQVLDEAVAQAREAAGDKDVFVMGGADVIRQALRAGHVEELSISIAPVVLGGGKRLFDGFEETLRLEHLRLLQSPLATHISYRVLR
jgi:riboflavin biosynthesis pyrimidine reductase